MDFRMVLISLFCEVIMDNNNWIRRIIGSGNFNNDVNDLIFCF